MAQRVFFGVLFSCEDRGHPGWDSEPALLLTLIVGPSEEARKIGRLKDELDLTYLFIAHGLAAVQHLSDRVAVMYLGRIVEIAERDQVAVGLQHPYAEALLSAVPVPNPEIERNRNRIILKGDVPSPLNLPSGCRFRTRCRSVMDRCAAEEPAFVDLGSRHLVACHLYDPEQ